MMTDCEPSLPYSLQSCSVSWNNTGCWLAWACNDRTAKIWTLEGALVRNCNKSPIIDVTVSNKGLTISYIQPREVITVATGGHTAPVDLVRFHPIEANTLCTSGLDSSIRIWDVRASGGSQKARIDLQGHGRCGPNAVSVEWGSIYTLIVTERDNKVHVYDLRKLNPSFGLKGARATSATPVHTFNLEQNDVTGCKMSPNGEFMVATTTLRGEGMGEFRIWSWKEGEDNTEIPENVVSYPGHTTPINRFTFSPDGNRLASGGSDTIVGLWDVSSMVCTNTILRGTKVIRSVTFSHDSRLIASSSDEEGIDIADADTGALIGNVKIGRRVGAEEIVFHPKLNWLACARTESQGMGGAQSPSPVVVAKLALIAA